jgi:anhydro-N-acetylmuramic acid kinase
MYWIGLMSGTSADAIDAALVEWPDDARTRPFRLVAYRETPLAAGLQARIHALAADAGGRGALRELAALHAELGDAFGAAACELIEEAPPGLGPVTGVASHGQTVAHHPDLGATLQIGDPARIAERSGLDVVSDFRARDLAVGGEGAPLAPFFHHAVLAARDENRLILNLGGIANLTWLPAGCPPEAVQAFDVGPANVLLDEVVRIDSEGRQQMDRGGVLAGRGRVHAETLERLLDDDFLRRPPPKSTGRERYGSEMAQALVAGWRQQERPVEDLLATLVAFTAAALGRAAKTWLEGGVVERVLLGGGGAANPTLRAALAEVFDPAPCEVLDRGGVPAAAAEAMAFSLMGRNALLGIPNHLPQVTGAAGPRVLGSLTRA